jgi:hypothetical protein
MLADFGLIPHWFPVAADIWICIFAHFIYKLMSFSTDVIMAL